MRQRIRTWVTLWIKENQYLPMDSDLPVDSDDDDERGTDEQKRRLLAMGCDLWVLVTKFAA